MKQTVQKTAPQIHINLLKPQGIPQNLPLRFVKWLMSYGRFLIIIVEIIVLLCFAARVVLDIELANLKKNIDSEVKNIQAHSADEALIKSTQQKLQLIQHNFDTYPDWDKLFTSLNSKMPSKVRLNSFHIEHLQNSKSVQFRIIGTTIDNNDISLFVNGLREKGVEESKKQFKDINLTNLSYDSGEISFTITGATR